MRWEGRFRSKSGISGGLGCNQQLSADKEFQAPAGFSLNSLRGRDAVPGKSALPAERTALRIHYALQGICYCQKVTRPQGEQRQVATNTTSPCRSRPRLKRGVIGFPQQVALPLGSGSPDERGRIGSVTLS